MPQSVPAYVADPRTVVNCLQSLPCCNISTQVMFMAYHSEVLQQERDRRRRSHLLSTVSGTLEAAAQSIGGDTAGVRRAGGGGHVYTAMAEAALAQVKNGVIYHPRWRHKNSTKTRSSMRYSGRLT